MERVKEAMFRYGDPEFDREYLRLGYHERPSRIEEADSILTIVAKSGKPLKMLDLGCGTGAHAMHWASIGHKVMGIDISQTFIDECRCKSAGLEIAFDTGDIKKLPYYGDFDVVTWIEPTFFDAEIVRAIYNYLDYDGAFIFDVRNPEHPKMKRVASNWRSWKEDGSVFHLETHETDQNTGLRHSKWIDIDVTTGKVTEKLNTFRPVSLEDRLHILQNNGFGNISLRTLSGEAFNGVSDDYWLWVVAKKY